MHGFVVTGKGREQGKAFAGRLAAVLLDEKTYYFEGAKGCEFVAGVAFRVHGKGEPVDVVLCFSCNELVVYVADPETKETARKREDFDDARPALVKLAKEAFPDDRVIQSLTAHRE